MRWLQLRGTSIRHLKISTPDGPEYSDTSHTAGRQHLQDVSMLVLPDLPNLQHLSVFGGVDFMPPELQLQAITLSPHLQSLSLYLQSGGSWDEATLEPLKHLRALSSLSLEICEMKGPLLVSPSLAELTQLEDLLLGCVSVEGLWSILSDETSHNHLMGTIGQLTGLRSLGLTNMVDSLPAGLERLVRLPFLELGLFDLEARELDPSPAFVLCTKLRNLSLTWIGGGSDEAWRSICNSLRLLPCLDTLQVSHMDLSGVQPSSWALPLGMTQLQLDECGMSLLQYAVCHTWRTFMWTIEMCS